MNEKFYIEAKVAKIDKNIKEAIKKAGIEYPHPSLAFFKATFAKIGEANGNKVMLAETVKDDVPFLIGCQMNKNHYRYGYIMGQIIDSYITDNDEIEIIFTFHKSIYEKEYQEALDLMTKGKLTVSFELKVDKNNIEVLENGVRKLSKVDFEGVGLLFAVKPAYRNAFVLENAMAQIEDLFNSSEDKQLCFASVKNISEKWVKIGQLIEEAIIENGGNKMDTKANEALLAKQKEFVLKEFGEELVKDWKDEDFLNEEKIIALRNSLKKEETPNVEAKVEEKKEEVKSEEKVEEKKEEAKVEEAQKSVVERETNVKETNTFDDKTKKEVIVTESEAVVKRDGKEVMKEVVNREVTYTYAQVEEIKADYEKKLSEKDKEISFIKENAKKIIEIRAELGSFVASLSDEELFDETKMKIARLEKENADLKAKKLETAEEKKEEVKSEEKVEEKKEEEIKATKKEEVVEEKVETSEDRVTMLVKQRYNKNK